MFDDLFSYIVMAFFVVAFLSSAIRILREYDARGCLYLGSVYGRSKDRA